MKVGQLKYLLRVLKDGQLSKQFNEAYSKELSTQDEEKHVHLKRVGDAAALYKAAEGITPEQRDSSGIDELEIWLPVSSGTQLLQPVPRAVPSSISSPRRSLGVTTTMDSRLTRQTTDLDGDQIQRFRFQSLQDTGLVGNLSFEQFLEHQDVFAVAVSTQPPPQHLDLENMEQDKLLLQGNLEELPRTILNGNIDRETIVDAITRLAITFQREGMVQVHADGLGDNSIVVDEGVDDLFVPLRKGNNWYLVVAKLSSGVITLYDSIPRTETDSLVEVISNLDMTMDVWREHRIAKCTVQADNDSSGLFLLLNAVAHFCGLQAPSEMYNGANLPGLRQWLALAIIKNQVEMRGRTYVPRTVRSVAERLLVFKIALTEVLRTARNIFEGPNEECATKLVVEAVNSALAEGDAPFVGSEAREAMMVMNHANIIIYAGETVLLID